MDPRNLYPPTEHAAYDDGERAAAPLSERVRSLRLPNEEARAGATSARVAWLVCLLLAASTGVLAWLLVNRNPTETTAAQPNPAAAKTAETTVVATPQSSGAIALDAKGYIIPQHQILVSPEVNARILELNFQEGDTVKEGFLLARLEDREYQAERDRAAAALQAAQHRFDELDRGYRKEEKEQAQAELSEAEAQLTQLKAAYQRNLELTKSNTISKNEFEESESKYRAMFQRVNRVRLAWRLMQEGPRQERIDAAKAEIEQARAELTRAEWRLGKCKIYAPIDGTILKKNAEKGNIVNPIAFNGSYSLCDMADLAKLEVDLSVQERDISRVKKGQKCKLRAEAYPDRVYEGEVSRIMPIADRAKGAVPVRVAIAIPPEEKAGTYLKPEMGAIVSFLNEKKQAE